MDPNDPTRPEASEARHDAYAAGGARESEDASFSQRLRARYGEDVDPGISLEGLGAADDSGASERRLERLAEQTPAALRYELRGEIARGGMGAVLRVWDEDLRRHLAMKVVIGGEEEFDLDSAPRVKPEKLSRFLEEAQITGQLDHPCIVPVHDLGIGEQGRVYFTMPLIKGRDLKQVFELTHTEDAHWTRTRCLDVFLKICDAMAFAHSKGVLHRDLKPANVMVGRFGEVYVMDWGLAKVLGREDKRDVRPREDASQASFVRTDRRDDLEADPDSPVVTMDGDVVGTPAYMSPEQAQGRTEILDERSDVYSVGSMLYHMLSGRMPYVPPGERVSPYTVLNAVRQGPPTTLHEIDPLLDPELVAVCEKAMARDARERYAGMEHLAEDLRAFQEGRVVAAYESGLWARFRKWVVRNRGLAVAISAALLISFGGLIALLMIKTSSLQQVQEKNEALETSEADLQASLENEREARDDADTARQRADAAAIEAQIRAEQARRESYAGNLIAADLSLRLNEVAEARRRLDACDEDLRGWEWRHLSLRADTSLWSVPRAGKPPWRLLAANQGDKRRLVVVSEQAVDVVDANTGEAVSGWYTRGQSVRASALSEDGEFLVVSTTGDDPDGGGQLLLYGVERGTALGSYQVPDAEVTALALATDPLRVYTGDERGVLTEWQLEQPYPRQLGPRREREIGALAVSPDGTRMAVGDRSGGLALLRLEEMEWREYAERSLHEGAVNSVAFSSDGSSVVSASADGTARVLRTVDGELSTVLSGHAGGLNAAAFGGRDRWLATAANDATVRIWHADTGRLRAVLRGHETRVLSLAVWGDEEYVLTCDENGSMRAWDPQWSRASLTVDAHRGSVRSLAFQQGGGQLVSVSEDHAAIQWDLVSGEEREILRGHESPLTAVATHLGETSYVAIGGESGGVELWSGPLSGAPRVVGRPEWAVHALAFSPDGSRLAVAWSNREVRVYATAGGEFLHGLEGHAGAITGLAWTPDGAHLVTGALDESVRLWEVDSTVELARFEEGLRWIKDVALDAQGRWLAAAGHDGYVRVYSLADRGLVALLGDGERPVDHVCFSSSGDRLAAAGGDGRVHLWHLPSGVKLLGLDATQEGDEPGALAELVTSLAFSPSDDRLVAGVSSGPPWARLGRIHVWETGNAATRIEARRRSASLQESVRPYVEAAFDEFPTVSAVLEALRVDELLRGDLDMQAEAERMVRTAGHESLYRRAWNDALAPERPRQVYEDARDRALEALEAAPGEPRYLLASALAHLRLARYESAGNDLSQVSELLMPPSSELHFAHATLAGLVDAQRDVDASPESAAENYASARGIFDELRAAGLAQPWMQPLLEELGALVPDPGLDG